MRIKSRFLFQEDDSKTDQCFFSFRVIFIDTVMTSSNQTRSRSFNVYCCSEKRILQDRNYDSANNLKEAAFALFQNAGFRDGNAILTYLNTNKTEVLLDVIPDLSQQNSPKDFFIRFVCFDNKYHHIIDHFIFRSS